MGVFLLLILIIFLITVYVIVKNHNKYIFLGLGTSGLNVTKSWIQNGGKGFVLMENKDNKEKIEQFNTISTIIRRITKRKKYIIVSGLGGKTSNKMLLNLIQKLDEKKIQFKILAFLPFKLEGSIRNNQAIRIHKKLINRKNYHYIDIQKELKKETTRELPELFKKMDQKGLEMIV